MIGNFKQILRFVAIFFILYTLFVLPWPGWHDMYRTIIHNLGNLLFGGLRGDETVVFGPLTTGTGTYDTKITLFDGAKTLYRDFPYSAHVYAYLPIAIVISLGLATPLPWRSRLKLVGLALAVLAGFLIMRILLLLLREWTRNDELNLWRTSKTVWCCIEVACGLAVKAPVPNFTMPFLIWAFLAKRLGAFWRLAGRTRA